MSFFIKVVIDTFSVMNKLRVRKQASCWIVPKRWETISFWSFVCLDFEEVWILGQVVVNIAVGYFVRSLSKQGIRGEVRS